MVSSTRSFDGGAYVAYLDLSSRQTMSRVAAVLTTEAQLALRWQSTKKALLEQGSVLEFLTTQGMDLSLWNELEYHKSNPELCCSDTGVG